MEALRQVNQEVNHWDSFEATRASKSKGEEKTLQTKWVAQKQLLNQKKTNFWQLEKGSQKLFPKAWEHFQKRLFKVMKEFPDLFDREYVSEELENHQKVMKEKQWEVLDATFLLKKPLLRDVCKSLSEGVKHAPKYAHFVKVFLLDLLVTQCLIPQSSHPELKKQDVRLTLMPWDMALSILHSLGKRLKRTDDEHPLEKSQLFGFLIQPDESNKLLHFDYGKECSLGVRWAHLSLLTLNYLNPVVEPQREYGVKVNFSVKVFRKGQQVGIQKRKLWKIRNYRDVILEEEKGWKDDIWGDHVLSWLMASSGTLQSEYGNTLVPTAFSQILLNCQGLVPVLMKITKDVIKTGNRMIKQESKALQRKEVTEVNKLRSRNLTYLSNRYKKLKQDYILLNEEVRKAWKEGNKDEVYLVGLTKKWSKLFTKTVMANPLCEKDPEGDFGHPIYLFHSVGKGWSGWFQNAVQGAKSFSGYEVAPDQKTQDREGDVEWMRTIWSKINLYGVGLHVKKDLPQLSTRAFKESEDTSLVELFWHKLWSLGGCVIASVKGTTTIPVSLQATLDGSEPKFSLRDPSKMEMALFSLKEAKACFTSGQWKLQTTLSSQKHYKKRKVQKNWSFSSLNDMKEFWDEVNQNGALAILRDGKNQQIEVGYRQGEAFFYIFHPVEGLEEDALIMHRRTAFFHCTDDWLEELTIEEVFEGFKMKNWKVLGPVSGELLPYQGRGIWEEKEFMN